MLRAKGVPTRWNVTYDGSGMGHCWTRITLTWKTPGHPAHHTYLTAQPDLATELISGIQSGR
ncbi:hypothetical protein [Streptomyces flavofungini]|uniref:Uncharacterized protein n=1 Tax=Streptomyces flavofungini TaxID=68200 RepID=A0ABS0X511_9ACTN|nr:hypothetical protein [Streptomyces flavofungini]MBJ3808191.1 hypothetical protein [Streptomyces flavofungini]